MFTPVGNEQINGQAKEDIYGAKAVLAFLETEHQKYEAQLRVPQRPEELKRTEKMLSAITSAMNILKTTNLSGLTQQ